MSREERATRIDVAKKTILAAQDNLERAVREIEIASRAEKRHASDALREALARLHAAQRELVVLDEILVSETE